MYVLLPIVLNTYESQLLSSLWIEEFEFME
jgi:hypothetical protein